MSQLLDAYLRIKQYLDRAESLYRRAQENNREDPLEIALPILYDFARKREDLVDPRITLFTGQYLACEYPHLVDEFIDERQLNTQQEYLGVLRETLQKKQEEEVALKEDITQKEGFAAQERSDKQDGLVRRIRVLS